MRMRWVLINKVINSNYFFCGSLRQSGLETSGLLYLNVCRHFIKNCVLERYTRYSTSKMDINRIKQLAKEQGINLEIQGLVCLPRELKKYTGSITRRQRRGGVFYEVRIYHKDFSCSKSFKTEAEVEQYIRLTNVREGLPIRNSFTVFADRVLVDLPGNKLLICNYEDLYLVETHTWCCSDGYAVTKTSSSANQQYFHNLAMRHIPTEITVDHINRNGLDNRKSNLRLVDWIQNINRGIKSNNTSGVTGVSYYKNPGTWVAKWQDIDCNQCREYFSLKKHTYAEAKEMAIKHCHRMIRSLPHYREALQLDAETQ